MANETDTRASGAVAWLSGVATTMARGGLQDDKDQLEWPDGAIWAELGCPRERRRSAGGPRFLTDSAEQALKAACAFSTAGDVDADVRAADGAKARLQA